MTAVPGTAVIQLTSGNNLLTINGVSNCKLDNIILDGNNVTFSNLSTSSAVLNLDWASHLEVIKCNIINSFACCTIGTCSYGIWGLDSNVQIDGCYITNCSNNGILIHTSSITGNSSRITNCSIFSINSGSGTGQNGNGINVSQAVGVNINGNTISRTQYSSIHCNGGGDAIIIGNNCSGAREFAIFIEAPAAGIIFTGASCAEIVSMAPAAESASPIPVSLVKVLPEASRSLETG